ncbi:MAG: class I SAM-dependent methyltransferase [Bacteroidota bacterium]
MNTVEKCVVCGSTSHESFLEVKDHMITQEMFTIVECESCGFHFTNPVPAKDKVGVYYQSEEYVSHSSSRKGLINWLYNIVRNRTLKQKVSWVKNAVHGQRLLDVGSGTGHFLRVARKKGLEGYGIEPDADARTFAHKVNHVRSCDQSELYSLEENSVDVITMWHVLEHIYDLRKDLSRMRNILSAGGKMFVAVPNMNAYDARYYGKFWAAYDVPRHLYHFRQQDIAKLFLDLGFQLEKVIPMKYDAFYVSMLSEKYRKRFSLLGGFIGLISNFRSKKFGYSSQVYVFRKD